MRRRTLLTIASIMIAAALAFLAFHMTRPSVAFISSESLPDGYDLIALYINHGIFFHQSRFILKRQEIGGLISYIQEQRGESEDV